MAQEEPTSDLFAGTGLGIRYVGKDHVYAYSGLYLANTNIQEVLSFTSGSGIIVGDLQLNAAVDDDDPGQVNITSANIYFNGTSIAILRAGVAGDDTTPMSERQRVIIPPFTTVVVNVDNNGTEIDRYLSVILTGRVYGTE